MFGERGQMVLCVALAPAGDQGEIGPYGRQIRRADRRQPACTLRLWWDPDRETLEAQTFGEICEEIVPVVDHPVEQQKKE